MNALGSFCLSDLMRKKKKVQTLDNQLTLTGCANANQANCGDVGSCPTLYPNSSFMGKAIFCSNDQIVSL